MVSCHFPSLPFHLDILLNFIIVFDVLHAILQVHLTAKVAMDIIPPEFALRGSYRHLIMSDNSHNSSTASMNMGGSTNDTLPTNQDNETIATFDEEDEEISSKRSLPIYQPTFANTIMPSTSMSPSWYSASTQKNSFAKWMSPSFYYSRPATSVILPDETPMFEELSQNEGCAADAFKGMCVPREIVTRCLEYRISKYAPRITPQRMRHVLQRFLKNMILKANEES